MELWELEKCFVEIQAQKYFRYCRNRVEMSDLMQAGFVALVDAVKNYDFGKDAAFTTVLWWYIHKEFANAAGFRTPNQKRGIQAGIYSIDAPVKGAEEIALVETIEDENTIIAFERVENRLYCEQLRKVFDAALSELPEQQARIIQLRYFDNRTQQETAHTLNTTRNRIAGDERKAIRQLRNNERINAMRWLDYHSEYIHTGLQTFKHSGYSQPEYITMIASGCRN